MPDFKPWQWATLIGLLIAVNIVVVGGLVLVIATYDLWTNPAYLASEPTVPPWATPTATQRPTFTLTYTPETWPTATVTRTPTSTPSPTATWTPLPTRTPWWTETPTSDRPPTDTPTPSSTPAPISSTNTPTLTPPPSATYTLMPPTNTSTPTASASPTPTHTRTPTFTPMPQATPTKTPTPAFTASPTSTPLPAQTSTPRRQPSATVTSSPSPTHTPRPLPTSTYTPTTTPSPTRTPSPTSSSTATATLSPSSTPTATASPSPTPTVSDTASPASESRPAETALLAGNDISLSWKPLAEAIVYRVYSDMGTGYGVYVYKSETIDHQLTNTHLRPGQRYQYRVGAVTPTGETVVAWSHAVTAYRPELQEARSEQISEGNGRSPITEGVSPQPVRSSVRVTPAPTPLPPDTVILGLLSATDYADDVDHTLTIVGEVRNDSHLDVGETTVTATFYATEGQVIGEASGSTMLHALAPGVRSPFMITLPQMAGLANYSLRATGRPVTLTTADTQLNVVNTRRFEDMTGFYHIAGVVENRSERRVESARVIVTLYDRAGRVVNVGFAYPQPLSLSPRDRADFDIAFTYYPKVFSHLAIATGD
jgi:hypothetical protein